MRVLVTSADAVSAAPRAVFSEYWDISRLDFSVWCWYRGERRQLFDLAKS